MCPGARTQARGAAPPLFLLLSPGRRAPGAFRTPVQYLAGSQGPRFAWGLLGDPPTGGEAAEVIAEVSEPWFDNDDGKDD